MMIAVEGMPLKQAAIWTGGSMIDMQIYILSIKGDDTYLNISNEYFSCSSQLFHIFVNGLWIESCNIPLDFKVVADEEKQQNGTI